MAGKIFAEQAEQFAVVVHALLQDKETRAAFTKAPIATLQQHGIEFKDPVTAKKVEAGLGAFLGRISDDDICPPIQFVATAYPPRVMSLTMVRSWVWTGPVVKAMSIAYVEKPEGIEEVIRVDQPRVDAFVNQVSMENTLAMREAKIAEQAARIAELETRLFNR
jgi:hypothetical protein